MDHVQTELGVSERRACRVLGQTRAVQRHTPRVRDDEDRLTGRIIEVAAVYGRYALPTPPGAIEIKTYPGARIAEVAGRGNPDRGMNGAFWPLFNHIKKHDIAMTSPVEMYYSGIPGENQAQTESWSMAFPYRTPDLNAPGIEGNVTVTRPTALWMSRPAGRTDGGTTPIASKRARKGPG